METEVNNERKAVDGDEYPYKGLPHIKIYYSTVDECLEKVGRMLSFSLELGAKFPKSKVSEMPILLIKKED